MRNRIRRIATAFIGNLFIIFGLTRKLKKKALNGDFIISVFFHAPSKELFEFCVSWLKNNNFHFLSQEDILLIAKENKTWPKGGIVITVDDGWQSNEENIVAIADKYEVPITIFLTAEPVENGTFWWPYIEVANQKKLTDISIESLKKIPNEERMIAFQNIKVGIKLNRHAMTIDQIKTISQSKHITIGSHTVSHPILPNCDSTRFIKN